MLPPDWSAVLPPDAVRVATDTWRSLPSTSTPPPDLAFAAYAACPPSRVRVVIIGQDPYPTPGHAQGLAFSVPEGVAPLPPSLRNIMAELERTHGMRLPSGDLRAWAQQGVLLLNRWLSLTSDRSVQRQWEVLTRATVRHCALSLPQPVAIVSWGRPAIALVGEVTGWECGPVPSHRLWLRSSHPSPLGARRPCQGASPFLGCGHFSTMDQFLQQSGERRIVWA